MFATTSIRRRLLLTLLSLIAIQANASVDLPDTLVIGKISHNPKKHYPYLKPMAQYAAAQLQDLGIRNVKVRMARSKQQMTQWLRDGYVDWVTETPFATAIFMRDAGAVPLAKKWKKGVATYRSLIFTRKQGDVQKIADLQGKVIAFEDDASTSAFYLPALMLRNAGLDLTRLDSLRSTPPATSVGFVFAKEEITISTMVHKGLAAAGSINNHDWQKDDHMPRVARGELQVIAESDELMRAVETVRPSLPRALRERLRTVLLNAGDDPAAQSALRAYQNTARFEGLSRAELDQLTLLQSLASDLENHLYP